jgi:shikimate dehydrogenase
MAGRKVFGLLGASLSHSYSESYFRKKFKELGLNDHLYLNFELANLHGFKQLISDEAELVGLNVTFPYKEAIIKYLDDLSSEAEEIGAVNCISIKNGKTIGYNTDVYGFTQSIKPFLDRNHEKALVLGTGGGAKAVAYALGQFRIPVFFATSDPAKKNKNTFPYKSVNERMLASCKLVVNCTPLGMFPQVDKCPPLPYDAFTAEHLVYDLIYNPEETLFLQKARQAGASTVNGLSMLHLQAEKSWEIWNS